SPAYVSADFCNPDPHGRQHRAGCPPRRSCPCPLFHTCGCPCFLPRTDRRFSACRRLPTHGRPVLPGGAYAPARSSLLNFPLHVPGSVCRCYLYYPFFPPPLLNPYP